MYPKLFALASFFLCSQAYSIKHIIPLQQPDGEVFDDGVLGIAPVFYSEFFPSDSNAPPAAMPMPIPGVLKGKPTPVIVESLSSVLPRSRGSDLDCAPYDPTVAVIVCPLGKECFACGGDGPLPIDPETKAQLDEAFKDFDRYFQATLPAQFVP